MRQANASLSDEHGLLDNEEKQIEDPGDGSDFEPAAQ